MTAATQLPSVAEIEALLLAAADNVGEVGWDCTPWKGMAVWQFRCPSAWLTDQAGWAFVADGGQWFYINEFIDETPAVTKKLLAAMAYDGCTTFDPHDWRGCERAMQITTESVTFDGERATVAVKLQLR